MPYLSSQMERTECEPKTIRSITTVGQLNFAITRLAVGFLAGWAKACGRSEPSYWMYNQAIGALECAKLELYRRMVAPYEDTKMEENGDVYK